MSNLRAPLVPRKANENNFVKGEIAHDVTNDEIVIKNSDGSNKNISDIIANEIITDLGIGNNNNGDSVQYNIWGIDIDLNNSNPATRVTYTNDAVGYTPLTVNLSTGEANYGSWRDFIEEVVGARPCIFDLGLESTKIEIMKFITYTNRDNISLDDNGNTVSLTDASTSRLYRSIMIEFNRLFYKVYKNGNILSFRISRTKIDDSYKCPAFMRNGKICEKMYISKYFNYNVAYAVYPGEKGYKPFISGHGRTPLANYTMYNLTYDEYFWNNYGYDDYTDQSWFTYAQYCYISFLCMMLTKSTDSSVLGTVDYGDEYALHNQYFYSRYPTNGFTSNKGMFFGKSTRCRYTSIFGIENLYGGFKHLMPDVSYRNGSGCYTLNNGNIFVRDDYNNNHKYEYNSVCDNLFPYNPYSYSVAGMNVDETNMLVSPVYSNSGSSNTYFCSYNNCGVHTGYIETSALYVGTTYFGVSSILRNTEYEAGGYYVGGVRSVILKK